MAVDPLEEHDEATFIIKLILFVVAILMVLGGYICYELGRVNGHADGWNDAWNEIPIEQRPPAPLNLEET